MRVVIADDTAILREGLARLLEENGVKVVGQAADATELLRAVEELNPDAALVDIRMPPTHTDEGLVAAETLRIPVIVLSQYVETAYALRLLEGGQPGRGYLLKDRVMDAAQLVAALERVVAGEVVVDPALIEPLVARRPLGDLTAREREVLALMAEGLTDRGIAERLWLTPKTVETHVRHILRKLALPAGTANNRRVHAVLTYLREGA